MSDDEEEAEDETAHLFGFEAKVQDIKRDLDPGKDWSTRLTACEVCLELGEQAGPRVWELIAQTCLLDSDTQVREAALAAFAPFSHDVKVDLAAKIAKDGLNFSQETRLLSRRIVRTAGAHAIGVLGFEYGSPYIIDMLHSLRDSSSTVRAATAGALGKWGPAVQPVDVTLFSIDFNPEQEQQWREQMQEALDKWLIERNFLIYVVDQSGQRLNWTEPFGSVQVGRTGSEPFLEMPVPESFPLTVYGKMGEMLLRELCRTIRKDLDVNVRCASCTALGMMLAGAGNPVIEDEATKKKKNKNRVEPETDDELPTVVVAVREIIAVMQTDTYSSVRVSAAQSIGIIGGEVCASQAECLFVAALQDETKEVRLAAAESLAKLGGLFTQQIAEALGMALEGGDGDAFIRQMAVDALHTVGGCAEAYVDKVEDATICVDHEVREIAALTIAALGKQAATPSGARLFNLALHDTEDYVQAAAVKALEVLGGQLEVSDYAEQLSVAMADERVAVRWGALQAMRALGINAIMPHAGRLAQLLSDDSWYVRRLAAELLDLLGPESAAYSLADLKEALINIDFDVRLTATNALAKLGLAASSCASAVAENIRTEENTSVRNACMHTLGQFGEQAALPFIDDIDLGLMSRDPAFRLATVLAVEHLGGEVVALRKDHLEVMASTDTKAEIAEIAERTLVAYRAKREREAAEREEAELAAAIASHPD
eukprot:TRINITY_DN62706_c0_g1_i1.p1 TRINITY_DN62706_c0_g1~~TRINITY_DN62706_c0_g1_i1.p1  ORF type:complete len:714 (-),score=159.97 TRINITY_DN62706_c0_g1_i1:72-2213(-)